MTFLNDRPTKLLIRVSKKTLRDIPLTKLGMGIYNSKICTTKVISRFMECGLVYIEKKGNMSLVKITKKGKDLCKDLFDLREKYGDGIVNL